MKKILFSLFFFICSALLLPQITNAHFLETDNNIGAILHVDPNDDPTVGKQASFFFDFKDKQNKFRADSCNCVFLIKENGKEIFSQPLFQNNATPSLENTSVFYTFPKIDVYEVVVSGKPTVSGTFQSFRLSWNFRIDQQNNISTKPIDTSLRFIQSNLSHVVLGGIGIGILLIMFIIQVRNDRKKEVKKRDKKNHNNKF